VKIALAILSAIVLVESYFLFGGHTVWLYAPHDGKWHHVQAGYPLGSGELRCWMTPGEIRKFEGVVWAHFDGKTDPYEPTP